MLKNSVPKVFLTGPYFEKRVEKFVNAIRILQQLYNFFDRPWN